MKKLIGTMVGCVVAYYTLDALCAASMALSWADLIDAKNDQAANALDDVYHKRYCKRDQKIFDFLKYGYLEHLKNKN